MQTRHVTFSLALTLAPLLGSQADAPREVPAPRQTVAGPMEPAAPLNAGAVLEAIVGSGSRPRARVRLSLMSLLTDAEATVHAAPRRPGEQPTMLGRMMLPRGQRRDMRVTVDLEPGLDNQLQFTARARKPDGTEEVQTLFLQVPLDPETQPELVDEFLQYRGAVSPDGGVR